jgi:hypothetical protein
MVKISQKIATESIDGIIEPIGFKVVTHDMKSLGLRSNLRLIEYPFGEWLFLPQCMIKEGKSEFGGIWLSRTMSKAYEIKDYMKEEYSEDARIFKAVIDEVLYVSSCRIKTNGIKLYEEIVR